MKVIINDLVFMHTFKKKSINIVLFFLYYSIFLKALIFTPQ